MRIQYQSIWTLLLYSTLTHGFSFTTGIPTSCDNLSVSWTGGKAPFELVLIPIFGTQRNVTIPSSAFDGSKGSYQFQVPIPPNNQILLTMSDATGFGTGGLSSLLTVGQSLGGTCNTSDPGTAFTFDFDYDANNSVQQCKNYTFSDYSGAVQPVTIAGFVPGGTIFLLEPPSGPLSYTWTSDVAQGSSVVFMMTDSLGRTGGVSNLYSAVAPEGGTCLTASPSSPSSSQSPSSSGAAGAPTHSGPSLPPLGAIIGAAVGCLILVAVLVTLGIIFIRRRKRNSGGYPSTFRVESPSSTPHDAQRASYPPRFNTFQYSGVPQTEPLYPSSFLPPGQYESERYNPPPPLEFRQSSYSKKNEVLAQQSTTHSSRTFTQTMSTSDGASTRPSSRYVQHRDVEEVLPPPEEIIDLPPQYDERRAPLLQLQP